MPVHQLPVSRREFLTRSAATVAALSLPLRSWAADSADPNTVAFLSDTHVPKSPDITARGDVNMTKNLQQVVGEVCQLQRPPAHVFVSGDCAYLHGLPEDYANFAGAIQPVTEAGLPLHLMTGNHDNREAMAEALRVRSPSDPLVKSKFVSVLELPKVNLFLIDTLTETNIVTGEIGKDQLAWLTREIDARKEKPAVILGHHNLQFTAPPEGKRYSGLADTAEFFELLKSRKHVKAYVFGHTHNWNTNNNEGIQFINLPPTSYVFRKGAPSGWVHAKFQDDGVDLELKTIDPAHKSNGEKKSIRWS